jgi:hypothetical protein
MTPATEMVELVERVEKATEGSRELDEILTAWSVGATRQEDATFDHKPAYHRDGFWVSIEPITPLTTSIDAALALTERLLPLQSADILREALTILSRRFAWHIALKQPGQMEQLPLAIILATLLAKTPNLIASRAPRASTFDVDKQR